MRKVNLFVLFRLGSLLFSLLAIICGKVHTLIGLLIEGKVLKFAQIRKERFSEERHIHESVKHPINVLQGKIIKIVTIMA